jgi:steroid 5-alpha reductase family enzyme
LVSSEIAGELDSLLPNILLLFGLALIISSIGFYRVVYFISIGYAFSMVAMALATVLLMGRELPWTSALQNLFLVLWGLRLGVYLVRRESHSSYRRELESTQERSAGTTLPQKVLIWISVSALYVLMFSPSLMSLTSASLVSPTLTSIVQSLGLLLMAGGLFLEALADKQKSDFKARFPTQFCDVGLYRWVRCPNYLGEIVYWAGNWVVGLLFYASLVRWAASSIGLVCIVLIMMGSTKRLERAQGERYGDLPGYQEYIRSVPVLFPFVPIYTLKNVRVFLE